jgi:hypothetical protein
MITYAATPVKRVQTICAPLGQSTRCVTTGSREASAATGFGRVAT